MTISTSPAPLRLGPYELLRRIATGGMAEVYLARRAGPHGFQKIVAVKSILPQYARDPDFVAMFVDEARVCARLGHPNIVQVFDFGEQDGELYMAMEYVDGTTGARVIRAAASQGEELPLDVCLHITLSILRALDYAHGARDDAGSPLKLVHRDVSPGNVLIDRIRRRQAHRLRHRAGGRDRAAHRRGTAQGQARIHVARAGGGARARRAQRYLHGGIVLAESLILRPLFSGGKELDVLLRIRDADVSVIDRTGNRVPDDVRAVLFRALARDPALRWQSAGAFAEALEDIIRRRRLQVGPSRLAAAVEKLGLVVGPDVEQETRDTSAKSTAPIDKDTGTRDALQSEDGEAPVSTEREGGGGPEAPERAPASEPLSVAPSIYRMQRPDGSIIGPVTLPHIIELFATGEATAQATIAREHGRFKPASDYLELGRFLTSPALKWDADLPSAAIDRGVLDPARLPTRIFHLAVRRETGALVLRDGPRQKRIFFVEGSPECVTSTEKRDACASSREPDKGMRGIGFVSPTLR